ncbi:response regulator [Neobacillus sp. 3P2-tot-E-2]|uniref:response regulator transcription factor n=1 Tax=Neobacillus sp. 3P2-tot-E-2 TaxID=3132212 RepID=UPI0039A117F4
MNILLVDDEISAIEAVKKGINWDLLAISCVFTAASMKQAMEELNKNDIDIVLSDIEMPRGTGLELLQWIKENKPGVECIFMTCHADFRYAQMAIQLGSLDYLLKPLNYEKVVQTVTKAIEKVRYEKNLRKNSGAWVENKKIVLKQFWKDFFVGDISPDKESLLKYIQAKEIGIDIEKTFIPVLVCIKKYPEDSGRNEKRLLEFSIKNISEELFEIGGTNKEVMEFTENSILIMFNINKTKYCRDLTEEIKAGCEELIRVIRNYFKMTISCYIGNQDNIISIPNQIEKMQLIDFNNVAFHKDIYLLRTFRHYHIEYSNSNFTKWSEFIQKNEFVTLLNEIKAILTAEENLRKIDRKFLQNFYKDFYFVLMSFAAKHNVFLSELFGDNTSNKIFQNAFISLDDLLKWVEYTINIIKDYVEENENIDNPVNKTKKYIESHISEETSMDDLAKKVHLNPDYLTRIFKKETGVSISRYIINRRMDIAKRLLIETDKTIGEIALEVGYYNYSSFNRIFTKIVDMSPQQFKKLYKKELV